MSWAFVLLAFYLGGAFCRFMESYSYTQAFGQSEEEIREFGELSPFMLFLTSLIEGVMWPFHLTYESDRH